MLGNVSSQSTGQREGNLAGQSQHESDWADSQENSELSVPAVPWSRIAGHDSMPPKQGLVVVCALAATIQVQQHLFFRLSPCNGHLQRGVYQSLTHAVVHCPTT